MKKTIIFLFALFCAFSLKSQLVDGWHPAVALTDSASFSSNPVVSAYPYNDPELYMFYEKGLINREIWWKKISEPMSEEQMLIGGLPEVNYRNPQILFLQFLIFECNINGNYDLFGVLVNENGLAGDIFQLTNTEGDESSFFANSYYADIHLCCWEVDGSIYTAEPLNSQDTIKLTGIYMVDSENCHDPVCSQNNITWRKVENNESHIYYSERNWPSYQWSDPDTIIGSGDNQNLILSKTSEWDGHVLGWQANEKIYFGGISGYSSPELPGIDNYYEPACFDPIILGKNFPGISSFAGQTGSNRDIYIIDEFLTGYELNLTDDTLINKYPEFFSGRTEFPYYEIIIIWQNEIEGFDVLNKSNAWYFTYGGINEGITLQMSLSPNPFSETLNIDLLNNQTNVILLEIFSMSGRKLFQREIQSQVNTLYSASWTPERDGINLTEGIYLVKITQGKSSVIKKVVYSK